MEIGRLTGKSVTELRFRAGPDEPVALGEILVAEARGGPINPAREADGSAPESIVARSSAGDVGAGDSGLPSEALHPPFYLRVVDLEYGAEARDPAWQDRIAGALMESDVVLFDRAQRLYKIVVTSPLGYLRDGRFRRPKTIPSHFASVRRPRAGDFAFLAPGDGDLELGHLRSGDEVLPDRLGIDPAVLSSHFGVFATTGMGKSNLMKVLAGACLETGRVGLLLLDPHGEYADGGAGQHGGRSLRGLLHHANQERLHVYSSRPILGFDVHDLVVSAQEVRVADFQNIYHLSGPQEEALWALGNRFGPEWIIRLAQMPVESLDGALGRDRFHPGTLNVLKRRAEQLLQQPVMHTDATLSTTKRILGHLEDGHVVLVDTSGLDPREELLVSAVLARSLLDKHRRAYRDPELFRQLPPACVSLEEAQRVLNARGGSQNIFAQIAREGRKFKVGLGAVTQQPRLIADELLSQFNTLFILGLADPTDRERVKGGARQDLSQVHKEIQMMEPGEVLITTPGAPFALPLKAHLFEDRVRAPAAKSRVVVDGAFY